MRHYRSGFYTFTVHQPTGRGRVLADAKIIIWPTHTFCVEQIKTNMHEHDLDGAVVDEDGRVLIEPNRETYKSFVEFERTKARWLGGRKISGT